MHREAALLETAVRFNNCTSIPPNLSHGRARGIKTKGSIFQFACIIDACAWNILAVAGLLYNMVANMVYCTVEGSSRNHTWSILAVAGLLYNMVANMGYCSVGGS